MDKSAVKECIRNLVEKFERDKHHHLSKDYIEAQARKDFIDPFFEALGWDISNKAGLPPFEREVLLEKGETTGFPDYNLRLGGTSKFFVEAKPPSEPLDKVAHILQAKSYAWNTKEVFIVVLTDFEEFRLFDASLRPDKKNPDSGLIFDLKYTEYLNNIEKLLLLSKEAVSQSSLERLLLKDAKSKRERIPVDKKFLQDMSLWREKLAKDVYKRNRGISVRTLNDVVQRLLDRIIFIRIAEDRKIMVPRTLFEIAERWKAEGKKKPIQYHLNNLFREINADLNGDVFKPHACEQYAVDSSLLAGIIKDLYFPNSPYLFDVIGVELLGSIYERYLGNTIRVTPGGRVKVEEKPEVRKAGGVYYTPQYIVKYIVENTVGKLVEGKTPKQIEKLKILDPACGSGSFLLGAFQYLIDYHIKYCREHPRAAHTHPLFPDLLKDLEGNYKLSIIKKGHILRNNIFGVDIDPQAVEVTMMSLYLKALEGERSLPTRQGLLPVLSDNIRCGNSLIGYNIFDQGLLFPDEEMERINPFEWKSKSAGFEEIIASGGFNCIIGNPPYGAEFSPQMKEYFIKKYIHQNYQYDSYLLFMEKAIGLLRKNGFFGMIIPNTWLTNLFLKNIRMLLVEQTSIKNIVHFFEKVFPKVTVDNEIVITQKSIPKNNVCKITTIDKNGGKTEYNISQKKWQSNKGDVINIFIDDETEKIITSILRISKSLANFCKVTVGIKPYQKGKGKPPQTVRVVRERIYDSNYQKDDTFRRYLRGKDINRYTIEPIEERWVSYGDWLAELRYSANFDAKEKILMRQTGDRPVATLDLNQYLCLNNMHAITQIDHNYNVRYILGCINSHLLDFFYETLNPEKGEALAEVKKTNVEKLPIRTINFDDPKEKAMHDRLVALVDRMLELNKRRHVLPASSQREAVEREIAITDEKIDDLVYELYVITDKERKIIEGS